MIKLSFHIRDTYCPSWGLKEAIREFVQNALDAQDAGHRMSTKWTPNEDNANVGRLVIGTEGVVLGREVWLLGETQKAQTKSRGQHGEGLKIGSMAAKRAGHSVHIWSGSELWIPTITETPAFPGRNVLEIRILPTSGGPDYIVEIEDVPKAVWDEAIASFLELQPPTKFWGCELGQVLAADDLRGKIFVRGCFVQSDPTLKFGYNLLHPFLDRDRRLIGSWEVKNEAAKLLVRMAEFDKTRIKECLIPLLNTGAPDVEQLYLYTSSAQDDEIASLFLAEYGPDAIAVRTEAEAKEVGHFGKLGVVVPQCYANVLEIKLGTLADHRARVTNGLTKLYTLDDLTPDERQTWMACAILVERATTTLGYRGIMSRMVPADFAERVLGTALEGNIQIARHIVKNESELRRVMVHEVAHDRGDDGSKTHERAEGEIHTEIERFLLDALRRAQVESGK